jgi:hypothetical protein
MCRMVMARNEMVRPSECTSGGLRPAKNTTAGSISQENAGSPIQPSPSDARVMPSWVAER